MPLLLFGGKGERYTSHRIILILCDEVDNVVRASPGPILLAHRACLNLRQVTNRGTSVLTTDDYAAFDAMVTILLYITLQNLTPVIRRISATESKKKEAMSNLTGKPSPIEAFWQKQLVVLLFFKMLISKKSQ